MKTLRCFVLFRYKEKWKVSVDWWHMQGTAKQSLRGMDGRWCWSTQSMMLSS